MLQCVAVCCSVLQCVAVCCSVLQCVAVCVYYSLHPIAHSLDLNMISGRLKLLNCKRTKSFGEAAQKSFPGDIFCFLMSGISSAV